MRPVFTNRYRHIGRYREIVNVLSRHGLGQVLEQFGLNSGIMSWKKNSSKIPSVGVAKRIRMVFEELGPTFIKLGQILSTRPDLLPPEFINELEKLQDMVPPVEFRLIRNTIEKELSMSLSAAFESLNEEPIASASIGQVHQARLTGGELVVVKVQKPGVRRAVETDLEILYDVARWLEIRTSWGKFYRVMSLVDEFASSIREEMDYTIEARNAERLADNLLNEHMVHVPRVHWEYSTPRILVLEYVEGTKISYIDKLDDAGISRNEVARRLAASIFKQLLEDGFFHADPHPGNVLIDKEGKIIFIDFGMMGRMNEWLRERLGSMLLSITRKDVDGIVRILLEIGHAQQKPDIKSLKGDIRNLFDKYYNRPLGEVKIGQALRELLGMSFVYHVRVPVELVLMIRCLVLLEGIIENLDPSISVVDLAQPFGKKLLKEKLKPQNITQASMNYMWRLSNIASDLPDNVSALLRTMEEGDLKVVVEHRNFKNFLSRLNLVGNRISFSLIIASIIIGSSLIARQSPRLLIWQVPIAEVGFVTAVTMGLWLLISIIRSGRI